ncbi:GFA family protein [Shewanella baltica]|uniref:GFA family protein n=1 Tax=Shewanella baltica TaxID=62322 RepID=UPI003D79EB6F
MQKWRSLLSQCNTGVGCLCGSRRAADVNGIATRFILRSRLSIEHHYAFKPSPCLKRIELPLNEQIFNTIGIRLKGQVTEFASSELIRRGFCDKCGTSLTYRHIQYPDYSTLSIASLDDANQVQPKYHIYTESQLNWLVIEDNCQRYLQGRSC